jgi:hypothetical protein
VNKYLQHKPVGPVGRRRIEADVPEAAP